MRKVQDLAGRVASKSDSSRLFLNVDKTKVMKIETDSLVMKACLLMEKQLKR